MASTPTNPNSPIPLILITADDVRGDPNTFAALLNNEFQNIIQKLNGLIGAAGTVSINSHLDLTGNSIRNVAPPELPGDVVNLGHANANYSASALAPQLEATGPSPLSTYRQLNNPNQRELSTSHLNSLGNTAPQTNNSNITFGAPAGGFYPGHNLLRRSGPRRWVIITVCSTKRFRCCTHHFQYQHYFPHQ